MRRVVLIVFSCVAAVVLAGCGAEGVTSPAPETVVGSLPKPTQEPATAAFKLKGDPAAGKAVFAKGGCGGCHTLKAAGATGTVGPNFDQVTPKPDYRLATSRVTNGKGVMPSFKGQLSDQQIADVAAFVVTSIGGKVP